MNVQGQIGPGFVQSGLVEGVPAHGRRVGTTWSLRPLPTQPILRSQNHRITEW